MSQIFNEIAKDIPQYVSDYVDMSDSVGYALSDHITKNFLDQKQVAKHFNIKQKTLSRWISGTYNFNLIELSKIAIYLDTTVSNLLNQKYE